MDTTFRERVGNANSLSMTRQASLRAAFSLLEMLVVLSVIALLLALMLPALTKARRAGRNLKCVANLRQVGERFIVFADDWAYASRGDRNGRSNFYIEDFQESIYLVDEFWQNPSAIRETMDASTQPLMCPEGPIELKRRANRPCSDGAVYPKENVSVGFNRRLHRPEATAAQTLLTSRILNYPNVPLALDVDGLGISPPDGNAYYVAPPQATADGYDNGAYWIPAMRHEGKLNVAFVGGHVAASRMPLDQPGWQWYFYPDS